MANREKVKTYRRVVAMPDVDTSDEENRSVELSFSSNAGLRQYDWWRGEWYSEILEHSAKAVQLSRLQSMGVALFNHNPDRVIGRLENVRLDGDKCRCKITFDRDDESNLIWEKVKAGTLRGVSVGFRVYEWENVKSDETSRDGVKGPARIARSWEPIEVSIVSCPADATVGVGRSFFRESGDDMSTKEKVQDALKRYQSGQLSREAFDSEMSAILTECDPDELDEATRFISDLRGAMGFDARAGKREDEDKDEDEREDDESDEDEDKKSDEQDRKKALDAERKRAAEITAVCTQFGVSQSDMARYISEGTPVLDVYRAVARFDSQSRSQHGAGFTGLPVGRRGHSVDMGIDEREKYRSAVTDGLRMRSGLTIEKPAPGANEFRHFSLLDLARDVLERNGERGIRGMAPMDVAARAFSTNDYPAIMSNLADVILKQAYQETPGTWNQWCRVGSVMDFKSQHLVRVGELPELEPVLEGGEYKMADLTETKDSYSIGTFGKKFALTRQALINDDLGAFTRIPQLFGTASARTINRAVYRLLVSNPRIAEDNKPVFDAAHNNTVSTGTAISYASLDVARIAMRRQTGLRKDKEKVTLNLTPSILIIPPELETATLQLLYSDTDITGNNPAVKNPFRNAFTPIVEAELQPYGWYLMASQSMIDTVEVAFLNGVQSPTLEQQQGWNVDGIEYKVRLDFGVWLYEYRGMYYNPGAAPGSN